MKKIITIFILPNEIDLYRDLINRIKNDITTYQLEDFWVDSTLCVSEEMVNWDESLISKQQVIQWYNEINKDIKGDFSIDYNGEIQGCVDKRRESNPNKYPQAISFTWLDADILFPEGTFYILNESVNNLKDSNFILTPQYPKMWDSSWDILVHPKYNSFGYDFMKTPEYDPNNSFGVYGDISLKPINPGIFKFGGGAITTFSSNLLKLFPIPNSFGPYGEEDTFVMQACSTFHQKYNIQQYLIKNLVYSQKNRDHIDRRNDIYVYDKRNEYRQISLNNFSNELSLLYLKLNK
jgi:hypothetical protein